MWVAAFTLAAGSTALPRAAAPDGVKLTTAGLFLRHEEPLRAYRAYRRMHAWSDHSGREAWLDAWTELHGRTFHYQIVSERGSDYIRNKVLHSILDREQELTGSGETQRSELTADNYDFAEAGRDADGSHVVQLKPRRKDVLLVDGRMVISPDGADLLRVEGRLSKNPSFWTSLVNVVRHYGRLLGVRVPVATESVAKVKFAGTAQLDVLYEYESVNGRPVSLSAQRR